MNPEEDDRTVIRPPSRTAQVQPSAPAAAPQAPTQSFAPTAQPTSLATAQAGVPSTGGGPHSLTLEPGTRLTEFEVTKTIGEGGFGIVYLAWDHSLDRKVALKEYMPSSLAFRAGHTEIKPRSERHQETFEAGLKSFINEAKLLAQFDHPSLLKVYRFWEANGTAYMVMPFLEGKTIRDTVKGLPTPPDEAWILSLMAPLMDALNMLHASQIYHRDIAPDNVLLMADTGRPLLLDFGAARRVIGEQTQALTAILKPGYAPVEQYADMPGLKQGPWTDVYALAAVVHWMIMGKTPPPSVGRLFDDPYVPLAQQAAGRYSDAFLRAIDHALMVMPEKRTPSIDAMRAELFGGAGGVAPTGEPMQPAAATYDTTARTHPPTRTHQQTARLEPGHAAAGTVQRAASRAAEPSTGDAPASRRSRLPLAIGAIAVVAVAAAIGVFALMKPKTPPVETPPTATGTTAPTGAASAATIPSTTTPAIASPASAVTPAVVAPPVASNPIVPPTTTTTPEPTPTTGMPATLPPRDTTPSVTTTRPAADPIVKKPPVVRTEPPRERRTEPTETRPAETRPAANDNSAECARIFQLISLGQADQSTMDRFRALRCR